MGLIRGVARTAAIAGTATAVSNRVSRRQANKWAAQDERDKQLQAGSGGKGAGIATSSRRLRTGSGNRATPHSRATATAGLPRRSRATPHSRGYAAATGPAPQQGAHRRRTTPSRTASATCGAQGPGSRPMRRNSPHRRQRFSAAD